MARHDDVLAVTTAAREAELVVVLAELGLSGLAPRAAVARHDSLAHDAGARFNVGHALADLGDRAAPFVAGDDRESDPAGVGQTAVEHLEVGAADAGDMAADEHVTRTG